MKRALLSIAVLAIFLVGCETKTQTGALTGGALGVGVGALAGGWEGALIGGAAGTVTGALIGYALDQRDRDALQKQSPRTLRKVDRGQQLDIADIKAMTKSEIDDNVIISQIESTGSQFHLTTSDIIDLKNFGVSQRVIDAMIRTSS